MTDQDAVRSVLQAYSDATYRGDVDLLKSLFHPKAVMNGFLNGQIGLGGPEPFFDQLAANPSMESAGAPYRAEITDIAVTDAIASGAVHETGFAGTMAFTNYFHLIKQDGRWLIVSKTYTTR